MVEPDRRRKTI